MKLLVRLYHKTVWHSESKERLAMVVYWVMMCAVCSVVVTETDCVLCELRGEAHETECLSRMIDCKFRESTF